MTKLAEIRANPFARHSNKPTRFPIKVGRNNFHSWEFCREGLQGFPMSFMFVSLTTQSGRLWYSWHGAFRRPGRWSHRSLAKQWKLRRLARSDQIERSSRDTRFKTSPIRSDLALIQLHDQVSTFDSRWILHAILQQSGNPVLRAPYHRL